MNEFLKDPHDSWPTEKLWEEIFTKSLTPGAIVSIETEGDVETSLPLTAEDISTAVQAGNGPHIRIVYRMDDGTPQGERRVIPIHMQTDRPVANADFSLVTLSLTIPLAPNCPGYDTVTKAITIEVPAAL